MSPGVESPLPRVVPDSGAALGGKFVPGGVSLQTKKCERALTFLVHCWY